ncbi:MAG: hypothetical protein JWP78_336 [Mucilaginibacter sp.]|nr:hypothetical protein [Mucilaginibacter sp.]
MSVENRNIFAPQVQHVLGAIAHNNHIEYQCRQVLHLWRKKNSFKLFSTGILLLREI